MIGGRASSTGDVLFARYLKVSCPVSDSKVPQLIATQFVYVYSVFYFPIITLVQTTILVFYRRVFHPSSFRTASTFLIVICILWFTTALVIKIGYPSHPIGYYFFGSRSANFNIHYIEFWLAMAIVELMLETTILLLPIRELYLLQFSSRKKYMCTAIFALGGFVIITGIMRIVRVYRT